MKETYQHEGLAGLYRGIGIATVRNIDRKGLFNERKVRISSCTCLIFHILWICQNTIQKEECKKLKNDCKSYIFPKRLCRIMKTLKISYVDFLQKQSVAFCGCQLMWSKKDSKYSKRIFAANSYLIRSNQISRVSNIITQLMPFSKSQRLKDFADYTE